MHEEEKGKEKKEKIARKGEDKRRKEKIKKNLEEEILAECS